MCHSFEMLTHTHTPTHLSCTVAAQSLQVLPVSEVVRQPAVLQRDSGVDEGRGTAVVIHKE